MNITITELVLLCWAMLGTGFYLAERSKFKNFVHMTDAVLRAVANKKATVVIEDDDNVTIEGSFK